jgi:hypothetical protein
MSSFNLTDFCHLQNTLNAALIPLVSKQVPRGFALATYLHHPATPTEQQSWFLTRDYPAVGVVCGTPSDGLVVLDFDDLTPLRFLVHEFPFLECTYTVQTRRGLHIYLRAPQSDVPSFSFAGGDLQGNGSYVVGAGSTVKGHCYIVSRDLPILTLNRHQWAGLLSILHPHNPPAVVPSSPTPPTAQPRPRFTAQRPAAAPAATPQPPYQCLPIYLGALDDGRNKALFKAACQGRDHGLTPEQVAEQLLSVFIHSPAAPTHPRQSLTQRHTEGCSTIDSAFAHPLRDSVATDPAGISGFPANLRQALVQNHQLALARVLDALLGDGIRPGQCFSRKQALVACHQAGVGTHSCNSALSAGAAGMLRIFVAVSGEVYNADRSETLTPPPAGVYVAKPKNNRGRPHKYYRMPHWETLLQAYSLEVVHASDPLPAEALGNVKRYRMAMAEALFQRRPGQYSRRWLAHLLGTHIATLSRYNRDWREADLLDDTPQTLPIHFNSLHHIPAEATERYHWLQREDGVCGEPSRRLASYWLHRGHTVEYVWKRPHRYGRDLPKPAPSVVVAQTRHEPPKPVSQPALLQETPDPVLWTTDPPDDPRVDYTHATAPEAQPRFILPNTFSVKPPAPYWRRVEFHGALIGFACPQHHLHVPITGNKRPDADMRCKACAGHSLSGLRDARHERYRLERTVLFASGGVYQGLSDTLTPLIWKIASPFDTHGRAYLADELEHATWQIEMPPALVARYFDSENPRFRWGLSQSLERLARLYIEEGLPLFGPEPLRLYFSMIQRHHLGIKQARTFLEGYVREYGQLTELEAALDSVDSQAFEGLGNIKDYTAYTVAAVKRGLEDG